MRHIVSLIVALAVALPAMASIATADVPPEMHYQGQLTDDLGAPLDTTVSMTFTIYSDSSGGMVVWTETQMGVDVDGGLFNVLLGSVMPVPDTLFADDWRWLGIQIGSDPEITPLTKLVTVPYAFRVATVDGATGGIVSGDVGIQSDLTVSGNIGIGTTSPDYKLHVTGSAATDPVLYAYNSGQGQGVYGFGGAFGSGSGVFGESDGGGAGVYGQNTDRAGVWGHSVSDKGVYGFSTTGTGVYGSGSSQGVYGFGGAFGGGSGVFGESDGGGAGVYGQNTNRSGVWGHSDSDKGVYGHSTTGTGVYYSGGLAGTGTKSCIVKTSKGPTLLYCQESPENWFEDFGQGTLANGRTHIELDALFLETVTINAANPMKVFVQLEGDCNGVYVSKGTSSFDVMELRSGTSNAPFSYRVVAKRKGFESKRLDYTAAGEDDPYLYPEAAQGMEKEPEKGKME
jgi:hypothetical protein